MNLLRRWKPSPAMAIACLALFMSLGGVSYGLATGSIDGREIRNNTIKTRDIRNNTIRSTDLRNNEVRGRDVRNSSLGGADVARDKLTGADILESSLGTVGRAGTASTADRAGSAGSADAVGGVTFRKFSYAAPTGAGFTTVLDFGGLVLQAECQADGDLRVRGNPAAGLAGSELSTAGFSGADSSFNPGDDTTVVAETDNTTTGTITFVAPNGAVVTIDAQGVEDTNDVLGTSNDCGFFGIASGG